MSKKKISFNQKPSSIENSKMIDDWVLQDNNKSLPTETVNIKRFTIVIPEILYKKLKIKCAKNSLKLKDYIINTLENNLID